PNRVAAVRYAGDFEVRRKGTRIGIAVGLAERSFRFQAVGMNQSFYNDLRIRRNFQVHSFRFHQRDRRIDKAARDGQLVDPIGNGLDRRISYSYGTTDDSGRFKWFPTSIGFGPVCRRIIGITDIEPGVKRSLNLSQIHSHVASSGVWVLGNPAGGGEIGRVIEAGS